MKHRFNDGVRSGVVASAALLSACVGPFPPPPGAYLAVPDGFDVSWDITQAYNAIDDGYGFLILLTVVVQDADNGDLPVNNVQVEILSGFEGAYLIPEAAILADTSVAEGCENGQYPEDECELWFGEAGTDFREIADGYVDIDNFHPTYMTTVTDRRGAAHAGLFIDTGMDDGYGFNVYFNIGIKDAEMEVTFLGPEEDTETTDTSGETGETGETGDTTETTETTPIE